ncbi:hypothetical protein [Propionispora hippei]|uniref:DUF5666 domain-containing protein n=1 Tax=Propionispora hippei DSM 15287 TaxID=1123003 RepID=A0A1M6MQJ7_9FIRM|nr:hypothetical protein [Propionispora hippei]SHJ85630.1 hypothetical protein SAMN02745170_03513 [Propionispora hippei DSM 15287]
MRRIVAIISGVLFLLLAVSPVLAEPAGPEGGPGVGTVTEGHAYLPKGIKLQARLLDTLDSRTSKPGDKFSFKLLQNVIVADTVIIAQGTTGEGVVKTVKRAGLFGRGGVIELEGVGIKTVNGIQVPVILRQHSANGGHTADLDWYDDASSATPALTVGVMSGIASGLEVQIGAGTKLILELPYAIDLQATPEQLQEQTKPPAPEAAGPVKPELAG